jgi:uridine phosphorylase
MMDFLVREVRAITVGPLAIVRFGTCGTLDANLPIGSIAIADRALLVQRVPDSFESDVPETKTEGNQEEKKDEKEKQKEERARNGQKGRTVREYYSISGWAPADPSLTKLLETHIRGEVGAERTVLAGNASCDSFYGSQARHDPGFRDEEDGLLERLAAHGVRTLEMETFQLFHLARVARVPGSIRTAAAAIVLANRVSNQFLDNYSIAAAEAQAGRAVLNALIEFTLNEDAEFLNNPSCVWNQENPNSVNEQAHHIARYDTLKALPTTGADSSQ